MERRNMAHLFLRGSIGYLLVIWGADKLINPAHGIRVSDALYAGLFSTLGIIKAFGIVEIGLGVAVMAGVLNRVAYPATAAITGATLVAVWRSIVDPWGWYLEGTNALFYPSVIIFAGVLVLWEDERQMRSARLSPPIERPDRDL